MVITLWAVLFFIVGIVLGVLAFGGIAIAISFFTKVLFFFSLICFLTSFILIVVERIILKRNDPIDRNPIDRNL